MPGTVASHRAAQLDGQQQARRSASSELGLLIGLRQLLRSGTGPPDEHGATPSG
jgi:hypothetical protein